METKEFRLTKEDKKILFISKLFAILTVIDMIVGVLIGKGNTLSSVLLGLLMVFMSGAMGIQYLMTFGLDAKKQRSEWKSEWKKAQYLVSLECWIRMGMVATISSIITFIVSLFIVGVSKNTLSLLGLCILFLYFRHLALKERTRIHELGYKVNFKAE